MKALITLLLLILPLASFGKAAFFRKEEAIRSAQIIAIVEILKIDPAQKKTGGWTYSEVADVKVLQVLKGRLPERTQLYGGENFICAQVKYKPGKHLVFLNHKDGLFTGANWHLGVLPIVGDSVEWFSNDTSVELKPTPLQTAVGQIKTVLENDWPILVQVRHDSRSATPELKIAYWQDGTVLMKTDKEGLVVGNVAAADGWKMWKGLRDAGFFTVEREHYVVPDSSYETIMVNHGGESGLHRWHGSLTRGFGGDVQTDAEYRVFVEMWKKTIAAISELKPDQVQPVANAAENGTFRGYVLAKPGETNWLNERKWKIRNNFE